MVKFKGLYLRGKIWWIRYADLDGRIIRESTGTTSKREAEYILSCRKKEVKEGKIPEVKRIKNHYFKDFAESYLLWAERRRSYESKKRFVLQLVDIFGNIPLRSFNARIVEQYQSERLKKGNRPSTVNRVIACLHHMFTKAVEWEMVEEEMLKKGKKGQATPGE